MRIDASRESRSRGSASGTRRKQNAKDKGLGYNGKEEKRPHARRRLHTLPCGRTPTLQFYELPLFQMLHRIFGEPGISRIPQASEPRDELTKYQTATILERVCPFCKGDLDEVKSSIRVLLWCVRCGYDYWYSKDER